MTRWLGKAHLTATLIWLSLIVPTVLWWKESILWVALMSIWANVAAHAAAWQSHREGEASRGDSSQGSGSDSG